MALALSGCADGIPTSGDGGLLPVEATTVELRLPFSEFGRDFQLFRGLGMPYMLPEAVVAQGWGGDVDSRALLRFGPLPNLIFVRPPDGTATQPDTTFVPFGGEVTLQIDTTLVGGTGPFLLEAASILEAWDFRSASWGFAIDTVGAQVPWSAPGGGAVVSLGVEEWDPSVLPEPPPGDEDGDEEEPEIPPFGLVTFPVDSATVVRWTEQGRTDRGLLVSGHTPESRLRVVGAQLSVNLRSEINPDTVVVVPINATELTFAYTPEPVLDPEAFPVGGSPGMRATFRFELPSEVSNSAICAQVACPLELLPSRLVYAGLELHTRDADPFGFRPLRPTVVELRPVLSPARLPRSPLAFPVACPTGSCPMLLPPTVVEEADFGVEPNRRVVLPLTAYVRDLLQPPDALPEAIPSTLALLFGIDVETGLEMRALQHATFWGPGTELEPVLRLILTITDGVPAP